MSHYTLETINNWIASGDAVLFGSRALGVHTPNSDWDVAVHIDQVPELVGFYKPNSLRHYFRVLPNHTAYLYTKQPLSVDDTTASIDILVLTSHNDLNTVKQAVEAVKASPVEQLRTKPIRVKLYQEALYKAGWTPKTKD